MSTCIVIEKALIVPHKMKLNLNFGMLVLWIQMTSSGKPDQVWEPIIDQAHCPGCRGGHYGCFHFGKHLMTWQDAKTYCESMGGGSRLAEPTDPDGNCDPVMARVIANLLPFSYPQDGLNWNAASVRLIVEY